MNLFKRGTKAEEGVSDEFLAAKKPVNTPYLNARRTWNGHVMGIMSSNQMWQAIGLVSLLIAMAAVGGIIHIGSQSKIIPMVFQQDASANTISVTKLDRVPDAVLIDYQTAVVNFITNTRTVTPDVSLQRKAVISAYAYLAPQDPATMKTNEYLNGSPERNPFKRAENETVSVEIRSVLPQTKDSWQVDWTETVRSRDGSLKSKPFNMRALVTTYQNTDTPVNENTFVNGHFIFIRDYNWSKQL